MKEYDSYGFKFSFWGVYVELSMNINWKKKNQMSQRYEKQHSSLPCIGLF